MQAQCFKLTRQNNEAEICYLNILEYMKQNTKFYSEKQFFDQKLKLLNHYVYTDITQAEDLYLDLEKQDIYFNLTQQQQYIFDSLIGSAFLMNKKKQFIKKGTSIIVSALNNPVLDDTIRSKLLLNLAVSKNFFDYPQKETHEINQEFKKYLIQNQNTESNIDNLFQSIKNNRVLQNSIEKAGPVELLLLSLSFNQFQFQFNSIQDILENKDILEKCDQFSLKSLQYLTELFYKTYRKDEPKMAIQLLQFQYELAQKQKKNQVQSIILYSSYFIDNKFYDQAEKLLLGVSKFDTFNKYKEDDFHTLFDYKKNIYDYENPQNDYNQAFSLALLANMYDLLGKSQQRDELIFVKKMFQMHCQIPRWAQIQANQDLLQIHTIQKQDMQFKTDDLYEEYSLTENYENEDKYNEEEFEEFMRQYKLNQQNY